MQGCARGRSHAGQAVVFASKEIGVLNNISTYKGHKYFARTIYVLHRNNPVQLTSLLGTMRVRGRTLG